MGLALLALAVPPAHADQPSAGKTSAPPPADVKAGAAPAGQVLLATETPPPIRAGACTLPESAKEPTEGSNSAAIIELDPETLWRPRGSEVRFTFGGEGYTVQSVRVCFAWSRGDGRGPAQVFVRSPLVRSISTASGKVEYGAVVPGLDTVSVGWPLRARAPGTYRFTALYLVPVADMQVVATLVLPGGKTTTDVAVILPVGVTSVLWAAALALVTLAAAAAFLYEVKISFDPAIDDPVLRVITGKDRYASLSQFQIMLWTFVVGGSAVYVMALSGNLIGLTSGTLTLLGIAGAAALLARVPGGGSSPDPGIQAAAAQSAAAQQAAALAGQAAQMANTPAADEAATRAGQAASAAQTLVARSAAAHAEQISTTAIRAMAEQGRQPRWSDLVVTDYTQGIDVTRIQMLIFTVISAAFVATQVTVTYQIPEIPQGYLLLMGISNGVYVGGRRIRDPASSGKSGGT